MTVPALTNAELIALSSAHAAWAGATASTFAAVVALGVAAWGARRDEGRRRRGLKDQELAFSFGIVGAFEMIKPLLNDAMADPHGAIARRRFVGMVDHAQMLTEAALGIQMFDMQMLRDAYSLRGVLSAIRSLATDPGAPIENAAVLEIIAPVLDDMIAADDRFFTRLPPISAIQGIRGRTELVRPVIVPGSGAGLTP